LETLSNTLKEIHYNIKVVKNYHKKTEGDTTNIKKCHTKMSKTTTQRNIIIYIIIKNTAPK